MVTNTTVRDLNPKTEALIKNDYLTLTLNLTLTLTLNLACTADLSGYRGCRIPASRNTGRADSGKGATYSFA